MKINRSRIWWRITLSLFFTLHSSLLTLSCTQDAYDKGEGKYSLMRADFVEANSNAQKEIDRITTDDGDILSASKPFKVKFVNTPDSVYRCVLYYNKVKDEKSQDVFEPISIGQVACPKIVTLAELDKEMKTDPVKFESAWMSKSGKYINMSLYLMTGTSDDEEAKHTLRIVQDTIVTNPDATRTSFLRIYHDQGGVPEYYSTQVYLSIITPEISADSVRIIIPTYKGNVEKTFQISSKR
ncbi:MAG: hypothetical protein IJQ04_04080 [Prevotella sp.]|nr:hypothetical protein [Prevotella sp.]